MNYIKRASLIFISIIILLYSACAFAHSGRTDANGGHYNRSTGEYHYHHGQPAHQHINGVCPYASKSGASSSISNKNSSSNSPSASSSNKSSTWIYWVLAIIAIYYVMKRIIERAETKKVQAKAHAEFLEEKKKYTELYSGKNIMDLVSKPSNTAIGNDGLPKDNNSSGWGINHTVYMSSVYGKYHRKNCRYAGKAMHAYYARNMEPCRICKPVIPNYDWYQDYLKIVQIKKRYGID